MCFAFAIKISSIFFPFLVDLVVILDLTPNIMYINYEITFIVNRTKQTFDYLHHEQNTTYIWLPWRVETYESSNDCNSIHVLF
jgi:hypothetical protein